MRLFTIKEIRSWGPCYDPSRHLNEDWTSNALDILDNEEIPFKDRLWVVLRTDLVSEKLMRVFAVWCARQVQHLMKDKRSLKALDIMDAYNEYRYLIDDKDWVEVWELERDAAAESAESAMYAAWSAESAMSAAESAMFAAWSATDSAARYAAAESAWSAAESAAWYAQKNKLKQMIISGLKTGDTK